MNYLIVIILNLLVGCSKVEKEEVNPAKDFMARIIGKNNIDKFEFTIDTTRHQSYSIKVSSNKVHISASNQVTYGLI